MCPFVVQTVWNIRQAVCWNAENLRHSCSSLFIASMLERMNNSHCARKVSSPSSPPSPPSPVSTTVTAAFHLPRHAGDDGAAVQPVALCEEATVLPLGRPLVLGLGPLMVGWGGRAQDPSLQNFNRLINAEKNAI